MKDLRKTERVENLKDFFKIIKKRKSNQTIENGILITLKDMKDMVEISDLLAKIAYNKGYSDCVEKHRHTMDNIKSAKLSTYRDVLSLETPSSENGKMSINS